MQVWGWYLGLVLRQIIKSQRLTSLLSSLLPPGPPPGLYEGYTTQQPEARPMTWEEMYLLQAVGGAEGPAAAAGGPDCSSDCSSGTSHSQDTQHFRKDVTCTSGPARHAAQHVYTCDAPPCSWQLCLPAPLSMHCNSLLLVRACSNQQPIPDLGQHTAGCSRTIVTPFGRDVM
jgi:hypothetical protein